MVEIFSKDTLKSTKRKVANHCKTPRQQRNKHRDFYFQKNKPKPKLQPRLGKMKLHKGCPNKLKQNNKIQKS